MKTQVLLTLTACALAVPAFADEAALKTAQKNNCAACHAPAQKLVGPSWSEIGKKYAGAAGAEAKLLAKVKRGGAGVWGPVPMPPNPGVPDADIKTVLRYALRTK
ncbi:MAG: c-type cytochrome [Burkholderiales bacterium]|nr:c-type cytochrome [Burkholderiales bacterium]